MSGDIPQMMMGSVVPLSSVAGDNTADKFAEALRAMQKNLVLLIEYNEIDAKVKRAKFLALVKEGFTEAQAVELCKAVY